MASFDRLSTTAWKEHVAEQSSNYFHARVPEVSKQTMNLIMRTQRNTNANLNKILTTFQYKGGFSTQAEAMQWLKSYSNSPEVTAILIEQANTLPEPQRTQMLTRISAPAYMSRMTRQQTLQLNIELNQQNLYSGMLSQRNTTFFNMVQEGYNRSFFDMSRLSGIAMSFDRLPERKINAILNRSLPTKYTKYFTHAWAERNQETMLAGIMKGQSVRNLTKDLTDVAKGEEYRAYRYVRTYSTAVTSEADHEAMKEAGVQQYEIAVTLDERTCDICGPLDHEVFNLEDEVEGENSPPFHFNCRCRKLSVIPGMNILNQERIARDENGKNIRVPRSMTYPEYKRQFLE